ncbi:MAG TPA: serine/threonine protein kinase, partial [Actinomycetota bacterium]|nr:serine/threonine protein kinase [Actinomycetota bacterium]
MQTDGSVTVVDGRYELERELGRGPTGAVWRARDVVLGRNVALKIVHPSLADDVAFCSALTDQVRRLASVDAPGLAKLFDTGEEDVLFHVHGLIEGESLRERWSMRRRPDAGAVVHIAIDLLHALERAHAAGVLHLHLSLDDVIVTPADEIVITDLA